MSWDRPAAADALVAVLAAATADLTPPPTCFPNPPSTFNPPAIIVSLPLTVTKHVPAFGIDRVTLVLLVAAGVTEADLVDELLGLASAAIEADKSLGGAVQLCNPDEWRNWRPGPNPAHVKRRTT
jgi:hypothetical protein